MKSLASHQHSEVITASQHYYWEECGTRKSAVIIKSRDQINRGLLCALSEWKCQGSIIIDYSQQLQQIRTTTHALDPFLCHDDYQVSIYHSISDLQKLTVHMASFEKCRMLYKRFKEGLADIHEDIRNVRSGIRIHSEGLVATS